jgi:hypothetical protein
MPTRFLSDAEIERLESFPEAIDARDLARYCHLARTTPPPQSTNGREFESPRASEPSMPVGARSGR